MSSHASTIIASRRSTSSCLGIGSPPPRSSSPDPWTGGRQSTNPRSPPDAYLTGYSTYPVSGAAASGGAAPNPYGAVVQIVYTTVFGALKGEATGFIIESDSTGGGIILTAAHVLNGIPPGAQISIYAANATYGSGGV